MPITLPDVGDGVTPDADFDDSVAELIEVLRPGLFEDRRGMFVSRTSGTNF
jgi:hypothetical protein